MPLPHARGVGGQADARESVLLQGWAQADNVSVSPQVLQLRSRPPNSFFSIALPHSSDNVAPDPRLVAPQAEGALGIHQLDPTRLHASALLTRGYLIFAGFAGFAGFVQY